MHVIGYYVMDTFLESCGYVIEILALLRVF